MNPPPARDEALTAKLNEELLEAYILETRNLKDVLCSPISQQTMNQRKVLMETLNFLNKQRRELQGLLEGSVVFCMYCPTIEALETLWSSNMDGSLLQLFTTAVNCDYLGLRKKHKLKRIIVEVSISDEQYASCRKEIQATMSSTTAVEKENMGENTIKVSLMQSLN